MSIAGVVLILAGLILLVLLPRSAAIEATPRLGLTSKSRGSGPELVREEASGSGSHHQAA